MDRGAVGAYDRLEVEVLGVLSITGFIPFPVLRFKMSFERRRSLLNLRDAYAYAFIAHDKSAADCA